MSEENSPIFVELTDEEGNIQTLEVIMSLEIDGQEYRAFFPTASSCTPFRDKWAMRRKATAFPP